jgi:hypothetical protein
MNHAQERILDELQAGPLTLDQLRDRLQRKRPEWLLHRLCRSGHVRDLGGAFELAR